RGDVAQGTGGRGAGLRRTGRGRLGGIWHCSGMIEEEDSNHRVTENTEKDTEEAERASGEKKRDLLCLTLSYFSVLFSVFSVTLWLALFLPDRIRDDLHLRPDRLLDHPDPHRRRHGRHHGNLRLSHPAGAQDLRLGAGPHRAQPRRPRFRAAL